MSDDKFAVLNQRPVHEWAWPRILVGIPLERAISYADQVFMRFLMIAANGPAFAEIPYSSRIDVVRNKMAQALLQSDYTHLLMLDIDHQHPADIIQRLAKWVIDDPSRRIISGLNFRRMEPYEPVGGYRDEHGKRITLYDWEEGLIPVDECGGASLLVERSVFEEMEPPWFFNIYDEVWDDNWPGEDFAFCRKAKALGIQTWIDTTVTSPHCTDGLVDANTWKIWCERHPELIKVHE